jgi:hypothetical protein
VCLSLCLDVSFYEPLSMHMMVCVCVCVFVSLSLCVYVCGYVYACVFEFVSI